MRGFRKLAATFSKTGPERMLEKSLHPVDSLAISTDTKRQILADVAAQSAAGQYRQALSLIDGALASTPLDAELHFSRANTLFSSGRFREALDANLQAEVLGCKLDELHLQRAWSCFQVGKLKDAEVWARKAVVAQPDRSEAHYALGAVLQAQKRIEEAIASHQRALELSPDSIHGLIDLAVCKLKQSDPAGAEWLLRRAVAVDRGNTMAWDMLGVVLGRQERFTEAFEAFERAQQLENSGGSEVDSFVNFANALRDDAQMQDAIARYESGLAQKPNVYGHGHYALALLAAGRFAEGWEQFEFRWIQEPLASTRPNFQQPVWSGQDLRGKTILLRAEQGFGDVIQFVRYAPSVKALGAKVLLQLNLGLERMAKSFVGVDGIWLPDQPSPAFDFYIHLMSLPRVFGTELDSIPADIPYLRAEAEKADRWAQSPAIGQSAKGWTGLGR